MFLPGKTPKSIAPWIWAFCCLIPAHTLASTAREKAPCQTSCAELQSLGAPRTHFTSVQGTLVNPPPAILNVARGDRVYRLGAGIMGGTVYRVVPEQGAPFVLKVYNHIDSAIADMAAFEHWQSLDLDEYVLAITGINITHRQVDQYEAHFALDIRFGQSIGITLKPDNVIVDAETLALVLIYPF